MSKPRILIADDEPLAVALLESYCRRIDCIEPAGTYTSATEALEVLKLGDIDIAVLDINMPSLNGLEVARAIEGRGVSVIFVTAYAGYALEGFKVHAADYLLKPVSYDDFAAAVSRVAAGRRASRRYIDVRSDYRQLRIPVEEIAYIEGLKDYVKIYVDGRDRPVLTLMNLKSLESLLPEGEFARVHRSYIVPLRRVEAYDRTSVTVAGVCLPVGSTYRARFIESLNSQHI